MNRVASVILGGGEGKRLSPLTLYRCKPAVPFGGRYLLIDIPLSLSIHAHCYKTFVLTQFLSAGLHQHIHRTYLASGMFSGGVELLAAEQSPSGKTWFKGTADAVRHHLGNLLEAPVDYFLILSGDQLYHFDFQKMVELAEATGASVVIGALPIDEQQARRMGVMQVDEQGWVRDFCEKPNEPHLLQKFRRGDIPQGAACECASHIGSMGIYLFTREALVKRLLEDEREDFGKHLIPSEVRCGKTYAFLYDGYWEDIGTIRAFYEANMALADEKPRFALHDEHAPFLGAQAPLPPAQLFSGEVCRALICEGVRSEASRVSHSILGPRSVIGSGTVVEDTYLMGNDYYDAEQLPYSLLPSRPRIGKNCHISRAIIDRNVVIGDGVVLSNTTGRQECVTPYATIRDGIVVVPRGTVIPDGFTL